MNCNACGANLPPGATACPVCNTPTPYNVAGPGAGSSPQYDPTVAAPQPQYGIPPTVYGGPSYGAPPSSDPYSSSNPYAAPPPPPNQYAAPPQYGQAGLYAGMQPPPPKRRSRIGLIIGIVAGVLVLACVGICGLLYAIGRSAGNPVQATVTAVSSTASAAHAPSGLSIDPTAASYVTNPQMSSAVDGDYNPTAPTTSFKVNQAIYATFRVEASAPEGYITANGTGMASSLSRAIHYIPKVLGGCVILLPGIISQQMELLNCTSVDGQIVAMPS